LKTVRTIAIFFLLLSALLLPTERVSAEETLIGVIMTGNSPYYSAMHDAFTDALNKRSAPQEKVRFILQRPFPDPIALSNAARKLIAADVDIIVAYGSPATLAVIDEKSRIPVVYAGVYDPAAINLKAANVTGCGYRIPLSSLLRYLKRLTDVSSLYVIYSSLEEDSVRQTKELSDLTRKQNLGLHEINIRTRGDLGEVANRKTGEGFFITCSSIVNQWLAEIMSSVKDNHRPSVAVIPDNNESGVIITLHQNPAAIGEKTAEMVSRVLHGERPEDIPPEILRETELVLNLREARDMGINVPIKIIAEATKVLR